MEILSKDVAMLSQLLQCIMLQMHQYRMHSIYKPGPDLYIADWLSHNNHAENKDQEVAGMSINVSAISTSVDMLVCTCIEDIQAAIHEECTPSGAEAIYITGLATEE